MDKLRYLAVAGACAALHNLIVIAGAVLGLHYALAASVSFVAVATAGYLLHARFTFAAEAAPAGFARYLLAMAGNYPLTLLMLFLLIDAARLPAWIATPIATAALVAFNYVASRWAIHRPEHGR